VDYFLALSRDDLSAKRELAYGVLASIAARKGGARGARQRAVKAIDDAWSKPASAVPLLRAAARLNLTAYAGQVRRLLADSDSQVAAAAKEAAVALKLDRATAAGLLGKLKYEDVVTRVGKAKGDVKEGEKLFTRLTCVNCHTVKEGEALKGPHLAGIGTRYSRVELLESILKPSAKIAQGFETHVITTVSGKKYTGFVVRETGTQVELRDGEGQVVVVKKANIDERLRSTVSVMPEGLLANATVDELVALVTYLESLKGKS
jgi:putative heme-binding domain-containing protein